jgi:hypothetical protein
MYESDFEVPDLLYVAIGCAQGHYEYGKHSEQEYPRFVHSWPGKKVCILIDPSLETPIYAIREGEPLDTTFICMKQTFEWPSRWQCVQSKSDMEFLYNLIQRVMDTPNAHMIVQDYSGAIIHPSYPIEKFPGIEKKVLFDVTYNNGGCSIDFDKIEILKDSNGDFIQPMFSKIQDIQKESIARVQAHERYTILSGGVLYLYRTQMGIKEPRDWCTAESVYSSAEQLYHIYGLPLRDTSTKVLRKLLLEVAFDFCAAANTPITEDSLLKMINSSEYEYNNLLKGLTDIVKKA